MRRIRVSSAMHHGFVAAVALTLLSLAQAFTPHAYSCNGVARRRILRRPTPVFAATPPAAPVKRKSGMNTPNRRKKVSTSKQEVSPLDMQRAMSPREAFLLYLKESPITLDWKPLEEDPGFRSVETIVRAADSRKAEDVSAYRVSNVTLGCNFHIFINGHSRAHLGGIQGEIEKQMLQQHNLTATIEGLPKDGWLILDFPEDILVHLMTPKMRGYYQLDRKWSLGEKINVSSWLAPADDFPTLEPIDQEVDPFWS